MKRLLVILFAVPVILVLVLVLGRMRWKFSAPPPPRPLPETVVSNVTVTTTFAELAVRPPGATNDLLGELILRDYADPQLPPENDLTLLARLMDNSLLLLKAAANRPLSANEDWSDLWRGKNAAHEEFLHAKHAALNERGQLIDRWQTPLFFHALGGGRYEVRSAGPDQAMWTADDLQRNANGTFLRATNSPTGPGY